MSDHSESDKKVNSASESNDDQDVEFATNLSELEDKKYSEDDNLEFKARPQSQAEPQKKIDEDFIFDKRDWNSMNIVWVVCLLLFVWKLKPNLVETTGIAQVADVSPIAVLLFEMLDSAIYLFRMLTPLWVALIFYKQPIRISSKHRIRVSFWGIESILEPTYPSMLQRVKIPWASMREFKFVTVKQIDYIQIYDHSPKLVGSIDLSIVDPAKLRDQLWVFLSEEHPLMKYLKTFSK